MSVSTVCRFRVAPARSSRVDTPISVSIQSQLPVESYLLENHARWMRMGVFKYSLGLGDVDLYFVLGTVTTTRWLVGSHLGASDSGSNGTSQTCSRTSIATLRLPTLASSGCPPSIMVLAMQPRR
ncbi:hypothetical protein OH76DRAFT_1409989 [Lentinus brumalis]|uniref:Uncharacterized protein n=1 Tax=Lentinus brumalis TaxID=2498619 RepID=A0A371CTG4_9APHY|nr:hypothetical protein OH76DRAFT_1409989 [Polyporus brumalis]